MKNETKQVSKVVLIVDDDPTSLEMLNKSISALGYTILTAVGGMQALAIAGAKHVDAVLLDIVMEDMDGIEVLKRIKQNSKLKRIPVIMVTGVHDRELIIQCMKNGAEDYLVKPVEHARLKILLNRLFAEQEPLKNNKPFFFTMSLSKTGARLQFGLAVVLISVLPVLALAYILINPYIDFAFSDEVAKTLIIISILLILLGYALLIKYPVNVIRLRHYLELLARGAVMKEEVHLIKDEDDLEAIETYIADIIHQTEERIRTIEAQACKLVEAEKKEVMIESLATACHHLGQPATVLCSYLEVMSRKEADKDMQAMIQECRTSAADMMDVFEKLQTLSVYKTEDYLSNSTSGDTIYNSMIKLDQ